MLEWAFTSEKARADDEPWPEPTRRFGKAALRHSKLEESRYTKLDR